MAIKNILSQMFDVRPRDGKGNLDLEKIKKIEHILNLKKAEIAYKLVEEFSSLESEVNNRSKRPKINLPTTIDDGITKPTEKLEEALDLVSETNLSLPTREQILRTFEEIDRLEKKLKEVKIRSIQKEEMKGEGIPKTVFLGSGILPGKLTKQEKTRINKRRKKETEQKIREILIGLKQIKSESTQELLISTEPVKSYLKVEKNKADLDVSLPWIKIPSQKKKELKSFVAAEKVEQKIKDKEVQTDFLEKKSSLQYINKIEMPEILKSKRNFFWPRLNKWKQLVGFGAASILIVFFIFSLILINKGFAVRADVLGSSLAAYKDFLSAKDAISSFNLDKARNDFHSAYQNFNKADQQANKLGKLLIIALERIPGGSVFSSGSHLIKAGEDFAVLGESLTQAIELYEDLDFSKLISLSADDPANNPTLTQRIAQTKNLLVKSQILLNDAKKHLDSISPKDLPKDIQPQINLIKNNLPDLQTVIKSTLDWSDIFLEILAHEKPKKYLLIFQNNSEIRPTGGFIGTYGILDLEDGNIKNLFIDGIFNPDGQLMEKIIPPKPIQKISTAWSTHDANWFADFPMSAQKVALFYEKTGGPTVDGVIALTPTVIEELLKITGPIVMSQYDIVLNSENFVEETQYKVEVDYDKDLNQPKKILVDFTPLFLDKLSEVAEEKWQNIFSVLDKMLKEKHIIFYFVDPKVEEAVVNQGWGGQLIETQGDYLSVIHTNICGYKTDRLIEEEINHQAEILEDGSIKDTVTIIRKHLGGNQKYEWFNKVNADYMRVYVPLGSKLISAQGHTREEIKSPVDYKAFYFKSDPDIEAQERTLRIHESGTEIFEENGKTVFGNWVYISPKESIKIVYQYILPFKLDLSQISDSYSLLIQKQSGSNGSRFYGKIIIPQDKEIAWQYPDQLKQNGHEFIFDSDLSIDRIYGMVLKN